MPAGCQLWLRPHVARTPVHPQRGPGGEPIKRFPINVEHWVELSRQVGQPAIHAHSSTANAAHRLEWLPCSASPNQPSSTRAAGVAGWRVPPGLDLQLPPSVCTDRGFPLSALLSSKPQGPQPGTHLHKCTHVCRQRSLVPIRELARLRGGEHRKKECALGWIEGASGLDNKAQGALASHRLRKGAWTQQ